MRDAWYSDKRDVIKWGTLIHLARRHRVRTIFQVTFRRFSERPRLESEDGVWPVAEEVWRHFRNLRDIRRLQRPCGVRVRVVDDWFDPKERRTYLRRVAAALRTEARRKVVLLDPDTGIAPANRTAAHIARDEITEVWKVLSPRDWLVLYQHARRARAWRGQVRSQFARACNHARVTVFTSEWAPDVTFFAAAKR